MMKVSDICNTQQLLFDRQLSIKLGGKQTIPDSFYKDGFFMLENVKDEDEAMNTVQSILSSIDPSKSPMLARFLPRTSLAKIDRIPVCEPVVDCKFQALHFDMGQPILPNIEQTIFNFTALYFPTNTKPSQAKTRLIPLRALREQKTWGTPDEAEAKLVNYVEKHGDGWGKVNSGRLSWFARFIDAMSGQEELIGFKENYTSDWFKVPGDKTGEQCLKKERDFFSKHGYNLDSIEHPINLRPGQLLIINNMEIVHGKIGIRQKAEIFQFMYGVESVSPDDVESIRKYVVSQLAT